jgi:hypothetical protein
MPVEPIKIPQNVYIEDHIVGPLTLKQIIIVTCGGGFSYAMFASISKAYGAVALPLEILVWIPAVVAAAFAFVRINDLSMMKLCLLFIEKMNKPPTRTWTPRRGIIINVRTFNTPKKQESKPSTVIERKQQRIEELSTLLDQPMAEAAHTENEDLGPANETVEHAKADVEAALVNARRPVNASRITATPLGDTPVDGVAGNASVSIFRDISKK